MLAGLSVFSVPAIYPEAFGLYVIEAMACGVPVVQPASASFPEMIARAGVGVLVSAGGAGGPLARKSGIQPVREERRPHQASSPESTPGRKLGVHDRQDACPPAIALAQAWYELLLQPEKLREMATASRRAAEQFYDVSVMRDGFLALARQILASGAGILPAAPLSGQDARSTLSGQDARSTLSGQDARSTLSGQDARSTLSGQDARSTLSGQDARSTLSGQDAQSTFSGQDARSTFSGQDARSTFSGQDARSTFSGQDARSTFSGQDARSTLSGQDARSTLSGQDARSTLSGQDSRSTFSGQDARSTLSGQDARSTFSGQDARSTFSG